MDQHLPATTDELTQQQVALIKQTIAKGATDDELTMFLEVARATGLNPFAKEIYFFKIGGKAVMPVGIDGLRRKAAESGDYAGQVGPFFCGTNCEWKDVWLSSEAPAACKVGVLRHGNPEPTWAVVKWSEFSKAAQGASGKFWRDLPTHMLAITAERHALRKAVPRLIEKLQATGAQVMDADYLIAKSEQAERQRALPQHIPPRDLGQQLYGEEIVGQSEGDEAGPGSPDGEKQSGDPKPAKWSEDDVTKLKLAIEERSLSSSEWRELLGLPNEPIVGDLVALGSVDHVIALLAKALDHATISGMANTQPILF